MMWKGIERGIRISKSGDANINSLSPTVLPKSESPLHETDVSSAIGYMKRLCPGYIHTTASHEAGESGHGFKIMGDSQ